MRNVGKAEASQDSFDTVKQEVCRCHIWRLCRVFKNCHLVCSEEVPHADRSVLTGIVVEQFALSNLLQRWPKPPDAVQQPFQNSLVGFRVDGCVSGYKFM
ncbi:hypothetical protein AVEN_174372-1 [Araneus ventricosus]|uniref:Uncharacterized protein n=1 Tax=Araneus ventricosus TaxID=182803 RepID=A0A4Y2VGI9_ARAVE|nr:hypothetical protein AVEN_174372-1 [Araneus ventricosus]